MKLVRYYLNHYYNFFVAKNPDKDWAMTRSVNLFLINVTVLMIAIVFAVSRSMTRIAEVFSRLYDQHKLIIQLSIVALCLTGSYIFRKYYKNYLESGGALVNSSIKDKWIVWLTIPAVVIAFFLSVVLLG
jgi:hypothetical protein